MERHVEARFAAIAVVAVASALPPRHASGVTVYSGIVNLTIPRNVDGLYLNVVSGQTSSSTFNTFDINILFSSNSGLNFFTSAPGTTPEQRGIVAQSATGPAILVDSVTPSSIFNTGIVSGSNFAPGSTNYFGFRFRNEANGNAVHYGYGLLTAYPSGAGDARLIGWAYESTPNTPIFMPPSPGTATLFAIGIASISCRRRG